MQQSTLRRSRRVSRAVYWRRRVVFFGLILLLPLLLYAGWRGYKFWHDPLTPQSRSGPAPASTRKFTVLVLGADDRANAPGRSDTMMLAFVDLDAGSVKLLSLPRDSYAQIPGHGWDKLNAAYALGKEGLAAKTVEGLLGVPVDYTTVVNMEGFASIVDAVGGVDIQVDETMDYDDPYDTPPLHIHIEKGLQHMYGEEALHYVRFRHDAESDWGRMKRQQTFLKALVQAAKQPANLAKFPSLLKTVMANVRTNLSPSQITQIANAAKEKIDAGGIMSGPSLTGEDIWSAQGYYLGLHLEEARKIARDLAGITPTPAMLSQDQKDVAAYQAALPKPAAAATAEPGTPAAANPDPTKPETGDTAGGKAGAPASPGQAGGGTQSTGQTPKPGSAGQTGTPGGQGSGSTGAGSEGAQTGFPLVVFDGSNGTQAQLLETLKKQGFRLSAFRATAAVDATTIIWYSAPQEAVEKLKALVPGAKVLRMTPGPGDPQLKLLLAPR